MQHCPPLQAKNIPKLGKCAPRSCSIEILCFGHLSAGNREVLAVEHFSHSNLWPPIVAPGNAALAPTAGKNIPKLGNDAPRSCSIEIFCLGHLSGGKREVLPVGNNSPTPTCMASNSSTRQCRIGPHCRQKHPQTGKRCPPVVFN